MSIAEAPLHRINSCLAGTGSEEGRFFIQHYSNHKRCNCVSRCGKELRLATRVCLADYFRPQEQMERRGMNPEEKTHTESKSCSVV
jgi:hypothetical protein